MTHLSYVNFAVFHALLCLLVVVFAACDGEGHSGLAAWCSAGAEWLEWWKGWLLRSGAFPLRSTGDGGAGQTAPSFFLLSPYPPVYPKPLGGGGMGDRARGERGEGDGAVTFFLLLLFSFIF